MKQDFKLIFLLTWVDVKVLRDDVQHKSDFLPCDWLPLNLRTYVCIPYLTQESLNRKSGLLVTMLKGVNLSCCARQMAVLQENLLCLYMKWSSQAKSLVFQWSGPLENIKNWGQLVYGLMENSCSKHLVLQCVRNSKAQYSSPHCIKFRWSGVPIWCSSSRRSINLWCISRIEAQLW